MTAAEGGIWPALSAKQHEAITTVISMSGAPAVKARLVLDAREKYAARCANTR